jgi:hypothetical protein
MPRQLEIVAMMKTMCVFAGGEDFSLNGVQATTGGVGRKTEDAG